MKSQIDFLTRLLSRFTGVCCVLVASFAGNTAYADETPQKLPFVQDWANAALLTQENDWANVPGLVGYRGDRLAAKPGTNPQTITADGNTAPFSALVNQKNPNSLRTGGVAEFDSIPNPTIALKGSATAAAPMVVLHLDTKGKQNIAVGYKLRDLDGSANNAVQPVSLQYRVGTNSAYTDLPAAIAPDATTGPGVATLVTPMVVTLPADANNQPLLQLRWVTANAEGNDEWVGIDDIAVIGDDLNGPAATDDWKAEAGKPFKPGKESKP